MIAFMFMAQTYVDNLFHVKWLDGEASLTHR